MKNRTLLLAGAFAAINGAWGADAPLVEINNACNGVISTAVAPPGSIVQLTGQLVHECGPNDPTGRTEYQNGLLIEASDVTVDLNGRSIRSAPATRNESLQTIGISITGQNVKLINSNRDSASIVDGFGVNLKIASSGVQVSGLNGENVVPNSAFPRAIASNFTFGYASSSTSILIDQAQAVRLSRITISNARAGGGAGITIQRSSDVETRDTQVDGIVNGIQIAASRGVTIAHSPMITGRTGSGIVVEETDSVAILSNVIANNVKNGVKVSGRNSAVTITENTIRSSGGCGISVSPSTESATISGNSFLANAGGNICR